MIPYVAVFGVGLVIGYILGRRARKYGAYEPLYFPLVLSYVLLPWMMQRFYFSDPAALEVRLLYAGSWASVAIGYAAGFWDNGDWRKRIKRKTSTALEKLLARVKELAPTPRPTPAPAR